LALLRGIFNNTLPAIALANPLFLCSMEFPGGWNPKMACRLYCMPATTDWPQESETKRFSLTRIADNFHLRSF
jgi:hypothetical protein